MEETLDRDIVERVKLVVARALDLSAERMSDIREDDHFRKDLGADSLDVVEIIIALYEEFAEEINDDAKSLPDARVFSCVGEAVRYFEGASRNGHTRHPRVRRMRNHAHGLP